MAEIGPNTRLRASCFYDATVAEGVTAFSPYNRMLMPTSFGHPEAEYKRLTEGVALWDVAVERQVQIEGPDAAALTQILCARDLSKIKEGRGKYVPMVDHWGVLINDPVVLKLSDTKFWLSIADNNILIWARGMAAERGMNVEICEPDVSPLAIQGPKSDEVGTALFGDWIRDLRFFGFTETSLNGIPLIVQRSGYSKQGGFELYLMDRKRGTELWNLVREAGKPWNIGPGNPNPAERIESGMLSFGGDTDDQTNPFEVRLDAYTHTHLDDEIIGMKALRQIKEEGPKRHQLGLILDDPKPMTGHAIWYDVFAEGRQAGSMTNGIWSPKLQRNIGFVLVERSVKIGDELEVSKNGQLLKGTTCDLPFM